MFHLNFSPMRRDDVLALSVAVDVLTINGDALDLTILPEGAILPRAAVDCDWLASDIERRDGVIHLTLILPIGLDAPETARFPTPCRITAAGPVALPGIPSEEGAA